MFVSVGVGVFVSVGVGVFVSVGVGVFVSVGVGVFVSLFVGVNIDPSELFLFPSPGFVLDGLLVSSAPTTPTLPSIRAHINSIMNIFLMFIHLTESQVPRG